jgi:hypothetical protein
MAILDRGILLQKTSFTDVRIEPVNRTWDVSVLKTITRAATDASNFQYIDDLSSTAISYARKVAKQPKFDFMITNEDDDFYMNTHGVSVVTNKSFTDLSNGKFYILNKNNVPIYFNLIEIENISLRDDNLNKIRIDKIDTILDNNYIFDVYVIKINENEVGELEISRLIRFENNKNEIVNPQQSIEFRATYNVLNIGNFNIQYFGKNNKNPNKKRGVIDIDLKVKCFGDKNLTREITDSVRISLNTINNSDFIRYSRRTVTDLNWQEDVQVKVEDNEYQWNKIVFYKDVSNLAELLKVNSYDAIGYGTNEPSNILLESYSLFKPAIYNYYARNGFQYVQNLYERNQTSTKKATKIRETNETFREIITKRVQGEKALQI